MLQFLDPVWVSLPAPLPSAEFYVPWRQQILLFNTKLKTVGASL
jgi:hypothetical protein